MRLAITIQPEENINFTALAASLTAWVAEHGSNNFVVGETLPSMADREIIISHKDLLTALQALHAALDSLGVSFEVKVMSD